VLKIFKLDACFWRGLTCYSDSVVKFASSGYLQINDLDQRNDIDKNKWVLDLDLYCFVFAYGVLQMWLKFSLYLAWLTYSSENVAVHSNDQIARALLNKREVWLKHSNSGCPMFQSASSEVFTSVLLTKHLVLQFGVSVWCLFSQATPTRSCWWSLVGVQLMAARNWSFAWLWMGSMSSLSPWLVQSHSANDKGLEQQ